MMISMYGIEWQWDYHGGGYRWYSKYNGARGPWTTEASAHAGGKEHENIIKALHGLAMDGKLNPRKDGGECR
jgi:hypothetical protein